MSENQVKVGTAEPKTAKSKRPPAEVIKVLMADGREVEFTGAKKRMDKEILLSDAGVAVRFDFRNGETRTFEVPSNLLLQAAGHGVSQKVGDETAGDEKVEDMVIHVDEMLDRLGRGEWSKVRGENDSFSGASIVIKAIVIASNGAKTVDDVKKFLQKMLDAAESKGQKLSRKDLYNSFRKPGTKTAAIIKQLEDEALSAEAKVDGEAALAELLAG
jgi:hypothetical protein